MTTLTPIERTYLLILLGHNPDGHSTIRPGGIMNALDVLALREKLIAMGEGDG